MNEWSWNNIDMIIYPSMKEWSWNNIDMTLYPSMKEWSWNNIDMTLYPSMKELSWNNIDMTLYPSMKELSWNNTDIAYINVWRDGSKYIFVYMHCLSLCSVWWKESWTNWWINEKCVFYASVIRNDCLPVLIY
jgi:hypothetical protein